jgi:hypothetical protein
VQVEVHRSEADHLGHDVYTGEPVAQLGVDAPVARRGLGLHSLPGGEQEPGRSADWVMHGLVRLGVDDGDHRVDHRPGREVLARARGRLESDHGLVGRYNRPFVLARPEMADLLREKQRGRSPSLDFRAGRISSLIRGSAAQ